MLTAIAAVSSPAFAQSTDSSSAADRAAATANKPTGQRPRLVVAISVDQFSADLFAEYRATFVSGLKRLASGATFPNGYQSHAATETCPGHATIMTGSHPARTGIIANNWIDLNLKRTDKTVYCAEDERIEGTSFGDITAATQGEYVPSAWHLLVPTLGERLKKQSPKSRNVAVSGKDRGALMMAGKEADAIYWWKGKGFETAAGRKISPAVAAVNADIGANIDKARAPYAIPAQCAARNRKISHGDGQSVGDYAFQRPEGGSRIFRATPDFDQATVAVAGALIDEMKLGQGEATDILSVSLSATDYIGHSFGTEGLEMCIQMEQLDQHIGTLLAKLDATGVDYVVALTADHGGHDLPERLTQQSMPQAQRVDAALNAKALDAKIKDELKIAGDEQLLYADSPFGDYYVSKALAPAQKEQVKAAAMRLIAAHPQVEAVIDGKSLDAMAIPTGSPDHWTLLQRARASYNAGRSGDFIVLLKQAVTPIATTARGYVATHGSPWDYDRRVPILFWRPGISHFEQPLAVKTVDIAPTLGSLIGVGIPADQIDGRCLDIDSGAGSNCN